MEIVTTPTIEWLARSAKQCTKRLLMVSPYVNDGVLEITGLVTPDVKLTLVTSIDLRDCAMGSSNL